MASYLKKLINSVVFWLLFYLVKRFLIEGILESIYLKSQWIDNIYLLRLKKTSW